MEEEGGSPGADPEAGTRPHTAGSPQVHDTENRGGTLVSPSSGEGLRDKWGSSQTLSPDDLQRILQTRQGPPVPHPQSGTAPTRLPTPALLELWFPLFKVMRCQLPRVLGSQGTGRGPWYLASFSTQALGSFPSSWTGSAHEQACGIAGDADSSHSVRRSPSSVWVGKTELWGDSLPERAAGMNRLLQLHKHLDRS